MGKTIQRARDWLRMESPSHRGGPGGIPDSCPREATRETRREGKELASSLHSVGT